MAGLHPAGFEPASSREKRIMSPVPSTTRPQMHLNLSFWNWWESNPRPLNQLEHIHSQV